MIRWCEHNRRSDGARGPQRRPCPLARGTRCVAGPGRGVPGHSAVVREQQRTADAGVSGPQTAGHPQGLVSAVECGWPPHKPGRPQWPSQHGVGARRAPCPLVCAVDQDRRRGRRTPRSGQVDRWRGWWTPLVRTARCCGLPQVRQVAWEHCGSGPLDSRQRNIHQYRTHDHAGRCRPTQPWTADFKREGRSLRGARSPDL